MTNTDPRMTTRASWQIAQGVINPFDPHGAVSSSHVLVIENGGWYCYTKGGTLVNSSTLAKFFSQLETVNVVFDPRIVYDAVADRFYAIAADGQNANAPTSNLLINVSKSGAPLDETGTHWHKLKYATDVGGTRWLDFPQIGFSGNDEVPVNENANKGVVTITGKLFQIGSASFVMGSYVIPKADLLLASPTLANLAFDETITGSNKFAAPIIDLDATSDTHTLWRWNNVISIDRLDADHSSKLISEGTSIAYPRPVGLDGTQPDGATDLDHAINDRIGVTPFLIGGYHYLAMPYATNPTDTESKIRVLKIDDATDTITAATTIAEDGLDLIYPSIGVSSNGDMVVGCTATGSDTYPGVMVFAGRDNGATLTFAAGVTVKAGESSYDVLIGPTRNRWGDYSAVVVDPDDPYRFWTFQTYAHNAGNTTGRQIQVTEIIHSPSGFADLLGLRGWAYGDNESLRERYNAFSSGEGDPTFFTDATAEPVFVAQATDTAYSFGED